MQLSNHLSEALTNLLSTKLRTFLAVLGILVGTASVVAMVSGGKLATREALAQFKLLGTDLLSVQLSANDGSANQKIALADVNKLNKVSPQIVSFAPYNTLYLPTSFEGKGFEAQVFGTTNAMQKIMKLQIMQGRFISFLDSYEPFCVVGKNVYQSIKALTYKNPIGQQIQIGKQFYTIIGVLKPADNNAFIYIDINNAIIVPLQSALLLSKYADVTNIVFQLKPDTDIDQLQVNLTHYLNQIAIDRQLYFQSAKELIKSMQKQQGILTLLLGLIGSISLLVGGIGVMNIMLVSVSERKREIGIRLAIGAKRKDIQLMFLIESMVLSLFGGIIGVILGIVASFILAKIKHWGFSLFLMPPLIGFTVSVLTGIFFGYYPAYKAAKLDPIETLRSE